jgi:hypothetical protein
MWITRYVKSFLESDKYDELESIGHHPDRKLLFEMGKRDWAMKMRSKICPPGSE